MTKVKELRDMGEDQIRLVWKDAAESLFKLRIQSQSEKLASPSVLREHRRTIARCQTILNQRGVLKKGEYAGNSSGTIENAPQVKKHAKKARLLGRAKVKERGQGDVARKPEFKKRTQSGT